MKKSLILKKRVELESFPKFKKFYDTHCSQLTFPVPIPQNTDPAGVGHYKAGKDSNEKFMPNKLIDATERKTNVPFPISAQAASNVGIDFAV